MSIKLSMNIADLRVNVERNEIIEILRKYKKKTFTRRGLVCKIGGYTNEECIAWGGWNDWPQKARTLEYKIVKQLDILTKEKKICVEKQGKQFWYYWNGK